MFNGGIINDYVNGLSSEFNVHIISDFDENLLFKGSSKLVPGELWRRRVKRINVCDNTLILYVF